MTGENEEVKPAKASLCPLGCMGRGKKLPDDEDVPPRQPENDEAPSLIDEYHDASFDEPGYARISSMMQDTPRDVDADVLDGNGVQVVEDVREDEARADAVAVSSEEEEEGEEDEEEGVEVEEVVEAQSFGTVEASVVYAQVNKPTAPHRDSVWPAESSAPLKVAEGVPTPRKAGSPPPSQRSTKRVNFDDSAEAGPSAPPAVDLGAFGDVMQTDLEDVGPAKPAPSSEKLLPGVSFNSYGMASMSVDQSAQLASPHRSFSSESSVEVQNLKKTIRRLTSELSHQLLAGGGEDVAEDRKLLPGKGPLPPWLCDSRVFSPLLAAYDDRLGARSQAADRCETQLQALELRIQDVVKENERLRLKLRESQVAGPASQTDWDVFAEQARLVLEENQLMIQQLALQQEKAQQARKEHTAECARLRCRIEELQTEGVEAKEEFDRLRAKLHEVKSKYQSAVMEREDQDLLGVDRVKALTRELQEAKDHHKQTSDELLKQLHAADRERARLADALADAVAEKEKLRLEVDGLKQLLHNKHRDNLLLQKFAKKHSSLQRYLESVIHEATNLQNERDSCKSALEAQEKEFAGLCQQLLADLQLHSADANGKQQNGVKKLQKLIGRLLDLLKDNEDKREEAEKQVKYLQSLLKQKSQELQLVEAEKRDVDEELEVAWRKAAAAE